MPKKFTVTATISTKDRFFDTLPITISSIISQTVRPEALLIFEDGEHLDLTQNPTYNNLFQTLERCNISWYVIFGEGKGQVLNHQKAINFVEERTKTDLIWRLDDDIQPEATVLETLLKQFEDDKVGAVGSLIIIPTEKLSASVPGGGSSLQGLLEGEMNDQWFIYPRGTPSFEVEHLNCSFLFRTKAAKHGYNMYLSPAGYREETLFTYEMFLNGWKLIVDPSVITWHHKNPKGGIRTYQDTSMWEHDDALFIERLYILNSTDKDEKIILLDNGIGDHVEFLRILPEILEKNKKVRIACCFPEIFEEYDNDGRVDLVSVASVSKWIGNPDSYNLYAFMAQRNWEKPIIDAFREMYL